MTDSRVPGNIEHSNSDQQKQQFSNNLLPNKEQVSTAATRHENVMYPTSVQGNVKLMVMGEGNVFPERCGVPARILGFLDFISYNIV